MSGTGETRQFFAGEERLFRIRLGEIRQIEARTGDPIGDVLERLSRCVHAMASEPGIAGLALGVRIRADDIRETIYQGLRGGGMKDAAAGQLIKLEIDDRGLQDLLDRAPVALRALWGAQEVPDTGEPQAGESPAGATNGSTSPPSTASGPP
jgi:hypothetical protein